MPNQIDAEKSAQNEAVIATFRAHGGQVPGREQPLLLLTTTGARTGRRHTTALVHSTDGDRLVVIASTYGNPHNPAWYHNLVADPNVTVEHGPNVYEATATVATGAERERLFRQQAEQMPFFATYQEKVSREIPVVVLERRG